MAVCQLNINEFISGQEPTKATSWLVAYKSGFNWSLNASEVFHVMT